MNEKPSTKDDIEEMRLWRCRYLPSGKGTLVEFKCNGVKLHKIYDNLQFVVGDEYGGRVYGFFLDSGTVSRRE